MIKNIIFDMGNVLLEYNPDVILEKVCSGSKERKAIKKELFGGPEWILGDSGEITNAERYAMVKKRLPKELHGKLKQCVNQWDICMLPIKGAKEFTRYAKEQGYGLYVLSNAAVEFYQYFAKQFDLDFFDGIVVSADINLLKPDLKIYKYILNTYGLKPEECLFLDDREENILGAKKVGIKGFLFQGEFEKVKKKLNKQKE